MVPGGRVRVVGHFPQALRCFRLSYAQDYRQLRFIGSTKPDLPAIREIVKRHSDAGAEGVRAVLFLHQNQLHESLKYPLMVMEETYDEKYLERCDFFGFTQGLMAARPSLGMNAPPFPSSPNDGNTSFEFCNGFPITRPGEIDIRNRESFGTKEARAFLGKNLYEQAGRRGSMVVANLRKSGGGYASLDELCTTLSSLFELLSPRLRLVGSVV